MPVAQPPSKARLIFVASFILLVLAVTLSFVREEASAAPSTAPSQAVPVSLPCAWTVLPGPTLGPNDTSFSLDVVSPSEMYVASDYYYGGNHLRRWNGSQWSSIALPAGFQLGLMDAVGHNDVWITDFGGEPGSAAHWNGSQWTVYALPRSSGAAPDSYTAMAAISDSDVWIVGYFQAGGQDPIAADALAVHWNGVQWNTVHIPGTVYLSQWRSIKALSSNDIWVGGYYYYGNSGLFSHYDGQSWSSFTQSTGHITALDVWPSGAIWASHEYFYGEPHLMNYDGSQWHEYSSNGIDVYNISIAALTDVWALGVGGLLHWDGMAWSGVNQPVSDGALVSIKALGPNNVWGVGTRGSGTNKTLFIAHYGTSCLPTPVPATRTPTLPPVATNTITMTPTPAPPPCPGERFTDVCPPDYFYPYVQALADDGILYGYASVPPCRNTLWMPCFNPYNGSTRGQISKIVSLAAGFNEPVTTRTFQDVPPGSTFYTYTERMAQRGIIVGYPCGGVGEPCVHPADIPYFRTNNAVTRGQLSKMTARAFNWQDPLTIQIFEDVPPGSTFYTYTTQLHNRSIISGYPCGSPNEPCLPPANLPYFRPNNNVIRGQTAKIVQLARIQPTPTVTGTSTPTFTSTPSSTPPTPTPTSSPPTATPTPDYALTPTPTATRTATLTTR